MWGTWKPAAGKFSSKVVLEAIRPHQFRASFRDELTIDDTPVVKPESLCCYVLDLADQWQVVQRLVDAVVGGNYRCSRGGRGPVAEGAWGCGGDEAKSHHFQSGLLRGTMVNINRTYGTQKHLHVYLFLLTIFGPIYYGPP